VSLHCWADGPETDDGMSTTCLLAAGHDGPHDWMRDDAFGVAFADHEQEEGNDE